MDGNEENLNTELDKLIRNVQQAAWSATQP